MATASTTTATPRFSLLPPIGSRAYYILLALVAIFILGPLGGIAAAYMNFSLGFFIGGQVLAGILGSLVTIGYGAEGRHGGDGRAHPDDDLARARRAADLAAHRLLPLHRHARRRPRHALHAARRRPHAAQVPVGPGSGEHPARAVRPGRAAPLDRAPRHRPRPRRRPHARRGEGGRRVPGRDRILDRKSTRLNSSH